MIFHPLYFGTNCSFRSSLEDAVKIPEHLAYIKARKEGSVLLKGKTSIPALHVRDVLFPAEILEKNVLRVWESFPKTRGSRRQRRYIDTRMARLALSLPVSAKSCIYKF
jgi:hypothetical protein